MDQLIGKVLRDRYRIQSLLARQKGRRTFLAGDLQAELSVDISKKEPESLVWLKVKSNFWRCLVIVKLLLFGPDFTWDDLKLFEREAEPTSDLYALGATLIYLASGQHPDQLPQREMRILFEDRVNLSPNLINWLKWLTEPSTDLRLKSAKQALETLRKPNLRDPGLTRVAKPFGSKVQVTNTQQMLEILIPPLGFHLGLIPSIGFAIGWNSFLVMWYYSISFATWSSGGWFGALFAICLFLGISLSLIWSILFTSLVEVRLRITQSKIVLTSEVWGLRCSTLTASRKNITKIELNPLCFERDPEGDIEIPPHINIWARKNWAEIKFMLQGSLTFAELDWLAQELSNWLNLPIDVK